MRGESLWTLFARICFGRLLLLVSDGTRTKREEAELIFFVEIHKRKLPDLKNVFHGISYEFYCSVFFIFQCHSNVFVDLNANFLNKKSLTSVCVVFKCIFFRTFSLRWFHGLQTTALPTSSTKAAAVSAGFRVEC